jgi:hypothetical protein
LVLSKSKRIANIKRTREIIKAHNEVLYIRKQIIFRIIFKLMTDERSFEIPTEKYDIILVRRQILF